MLDAVVRLIRLLDKPAVKTSHIDEAIKALSVTLTDEEAEQLEASYPPRADPVVKVRYGTIQPLQKRLIFSIANRFSLLRRRHR
ncbi:hypothetical protein HYD27_04315 [Paenibacillus sp. S150]|nr:hypothetical protein [Paenibacillus sp. S150]MBW4080612.1 hypothetical protein [Paenibacillus sp. S150]